MVTSGISKAESETLKDARLRCQTQPCRLTKPYPEALSSVAPDGRRDQSNQSSPQAGDVTDLLEGKRYCTPWILHGAAIFLGRKGASENCVAYPGRRRIRRHGSCVPLFALPAM